MESTGRGATDEGGQQDVLFEIPSQPTSTSLADFYLDRMQRRIVQSYYGGPVKVIGSAGTGKTVVALHRAKWLAERGRSVLLCTYNVQLAKRLSAQMDEVCPPEFRGRVRVTHVKEVVRELQSRLSSAGAISSCRLVEQSVAIRQLGEVGGSSEPYLVEWERFIAPRAVWTLSEYEQLERVGAKPMHMAQRREMWRTFDCAWRVLRERGLVDMHSLCRRIHEADWHVSGISLYDAVIVDECQDLCLHELKLLRRLCADPSLLLVCGDPAQRIFAPVVNLPEAGIPCPGSRTFRFERAYRSTKQIMALAESVLGQLDLTWDGTERPVPLNAGEGTPPVVMRFLNRPDEVEFISKQIAQIQQTDPRQTIGILVPTLATGVRLASSLSMRGIRVRQLDAEGAAQDGARVFWQTYNSAKGMEFDVCFLPLLEWESLRQGTLGSKSDRSNSEHLRRLLHVVLSRARSAVFVSYVGDGAVGGGE